jgi:formylglycine-generating enzyme required for sulfatase activity
MRYKRKMVLWGLLILALGMACSSGSGYEGAEMVLVEGGSFRMGDVFGDGRENEQPVHEIKMDSFYMAKYELTIGEFREFVEATGYKTTAELDGGAQIYNGEAMVQDSAACWNTSSRMTAIRLSASRGMMLSSIAIGAARKKA